MSVWLIYWERIEMGVLGVFGVRNASTYLYYGLHNIQHRGQEGAGIVTFTEEGRPCRHRGLGLLSEVFSDGNVLGLEGEIGIGSVKYGNVRKGGLDNVDPILFYQSKGDFAVACDGNIINARQISALLEKRGVIFQTVTDSEIFAHLVKKNNGEDRIVNILKALNMIEGGFSILVLTKNRIYACRDKYGIKPLALGTLGDGYVVGSESCAFSIMGAKSR